MLFKEHEGIERYWDGTVAGLLSGILVILFFFAADILVFEPFATPRFLVGTFAEIDLGASAGSFLSFGQVWLFTFFHLVAFSVMGVGAEIFFERTRFRPRILAGAVYGAVVGPALLAASMFFTETNMADWPGWPLVFVANLLAGVAMALYLGQSGKS